MEENKKTGDEDSLDVSVRGYKPDLRLGLMAGGAKAKYLEALISGEKPLEKNVEKGGSTQNNSKS